MPSLREKKPAHSGKIGVRKYCADMFALLRIIISVWFFRFVKKKLYFCNL